MTPAGFSPDKFSSVKAYCLYQKNSDLFAPTTYLIKQQKMSMNQVKCMHSLAPLGDPYKVSRTLFCPIIIPCF
jgi:hypothetical protein